MRQFKITAIVDIDQIEEVKPTPTPTPEPPKVEEPTPAPTPAPEPTPPVTPAPTPPISAGPERVSFSQQFYEGIRSGELILEPSKIYVVDKINMTPVNHPLKIHTKNRGRANVLIGIEGYDGVNQQQSGSIILLQNGADVHIKDVNFGQPKPAYTTAPFFPSFFRAENNHLARWTAIVQNCDTGALGKNGGFGLGLLYGGPRTNHAALINFNHNGSGLMEAKNPYPGAKMQIVMDDVTTDYANPELYGSHKLLVSGILEKDRFTITSDHSFEFFLNNHFFITDKGSNRSFILHIGRFNFQIDRNDALIDKKTCKIRPVPAKGDRVKIVDGAAFFIAREPQAGDSFVIGEQRFTITKKDRTHADKWVTWAGSKDHELAFQLECTLDQKIKDGEYLLDSYESSLDLIGEEQESYLIYKGNSHFPSTVDTPFAFWQILQGDLMDHQCYNHSMISLWARNVILEGYYRQSQNGKGDTLGYNMHNCRGFKDEFNPPVSITTDQPMPEAIASRLKLMS